MPIHWMPPTPILPQPIDDRLRWGIGVYSIMHLDAIPEDFARSEIGEKWLKFQSDWFFKGINAESLIPREGIDKKAALQHLAAIQSSFEPKHEHKRVSVAYLAYLWFEDASEWAPLPPPLFMDVEGT